MVFKLRKVLQRNAKKPLNVVIPAAGLSSRYPFNRPKWMLTHPNTDLMIHRVMEIFDEFDANFYIGILSSHVKDLDVKVLFPKERYPKLKVVILPTPTTGPADTVTQIINLAGIKEGGIFVKDVDSWFNLDSGIDLNENFICYVDASEITVNDLGQKSFLKINKYSGIVHDIVEKQIISNYVNVGGYYFKDALEFVKSFKKVRQELWTNTKEIFTSHVIQYMLGRTPVYYDNTFRGVKVNEYVDVGTMGEWRSYVQNYITLFCDIDGTILYNESEYFKPYYREQPKSRSKNVEYLKEKQSKGACLIFTTARKEKYRSVTEEALKNLGFENFRLIMGIPHGPRVLINDYHVTNPYPTAIAVNLERNKGNIEDFI